MSGNDEPGTDRKFGETDGENETENLKEVDWEGLAGLPYVVKKGLI